MNFNKISDILKSGHKKKNNEKSQTTTVLNILGEKNISRVKACQVSGVGKKDRKSVV